jgi:putative lipoprotein
MKGIPVLWLFAVLALALAGCSSDGGLVRPDRPVMTGTVMYRARIALPPTAVLTIRLLDITRKDAPAVVLAERSISNPGNPPMKFELPYPYGGITAKRHYVIEARIEVDGRMRFFSMEAHAVTPENAALPHEVWVEQTNEN